MARARSLPLKELRAECRSLEVAVTANKLATENDLAPHRPGGPENPDTGPRGYLRYVHILGRFHAPNLTAAVTPVADRLKEVITNAVTHRSAQLTLSSLDDEGQPRIVHVYQKSRRALAWMHARDCRIQWLGGAFRLLKKHATPEQIGDGLLERTMEESSYHLSLLVWAAVTPGPWLPFDPSDPRPAIPAWVTLLEPVDHLQIRELFRSINGLQLEILAQAIAGLEGSGESGLPLWASCVAQIGDQQGVEFDVIDRDRELNGELAGVYIRAKAYEEQKAAAERKGAD